MQDAEWISEEDYFRDWFPIQAQMVHLRQLDEAPDETPFRDPNWELVLIAGELGTVGLNDELYHYPDIKPTITSESDPIYWALQKRGVERVLITLRQETDKIGEHRELGNALLPPTAEALDKIYASLQTSFGSPIYMFDQTGDWCAIEYSFDRCTYLGGTPKFMQTFYEVAGGKEAVIKRFQHNDYLGTCDFMRDEQQERVNAIYALAGWPVPEYPDEPYPIEKGPNKGKLPRF